MLRFETFFKGLIFRPGHGLGFGMQPAAPPERGIVTVSINCIGGFHLCLTPRLTLTSFHATNITHFIVLIKAA